MPRKKPNFLTGLNVVAPTTWATIWRRWSREEGRLKKWRRHYRREGFSTWGAWRRAVVVIPFGLSRRRWKIYQVSDPRVVARWHGGPFPRWVTGPYRGVQTRSFAWLASTGRTNEEGKPSMRGKLPRIMFMFGLIYRGRIVVLDGIHRSVAVAERLKVGKVVPSKILIALAETEKLPTLKKSLK